VSWRRPSSSPFEVRLPAFRHSPQFPQVASFVLLSCAVCLISSLGTFSAAPTSHAFPLGWVVSRLRRRFHSNSKPKYRVHGETKESPQIEAKLCRTLVHLCSRRSALAEVRVQRELERRTGDNGLSTLKKIISHNTILRDEPIYLATHCGDGLKCGHTGCLRRSERGVLIQSEEVACSRR
jgi:hypothetical protein